jgi:hypothetical protein
MLKGGRPRSIQAKCDLTWVNSFRDDLNEIFYQIMSNLHYRHKSAERQISHKNPQYTLNLHCYVAEVEI